MGKGTRNRAKREAEKADAARDDAIRGAVAELVAVQTFEEYQALSGRPEFALPHAKRVLEEFAAMPAYGAMAARAIPLLRGVQRGDLPGAWSEHEALVAAIQPRLERLDQLEQAAKEATDRADHAKAIERLTEALQIADEVGFGASAFEILQRVGVSYLNLHTLGRSEEVEAAIGAFEAALELAPAGEMAAYGLMRLSTAYGERLRGDRSDNLAKAVELLRVALDQASATEDTALRTTIQVNLSVALGRSEGGDRLSIAQEAVSSCRAALRERSPDVDADDWAYAQINLGAALDNLATVSGSARSDARTALNSVLDHQRQIKDRSLIGVAHHLLARIEVAATQRSADELLEEYDTTGVLQDPDFTVELEAARTHYEHALRLTTTDPIRRGRVLQELGDVLETLGDTDRAIEVLEDALTVLRPSTAPDACQSAAWRLGSIFSDRREWERAAGVWRQAVEASEVALHSRMDSVSREREAGQAGNLYRWAAYAIARAGDVKEAASILDAGRGRELARRLRDDHALAGIPSELQQRYQTAAATLRASPLVGDDATAASRQLQEVIAEIRALPGQAAFATTPAWREIAAGAERGFPVVYVNPAPTGSMILAVAVDDDGDTSATVRFVDITSQHVFMRLMVGDAMDAESPPNTHPPSSYMIAAAAETDDDDLIGRSLDQILPWLGEALARHVDDLLQQIGASGVTLIPCGPLALAPLHAAIWTDGAGNKPCLVDRYVIRHAPSARVAAASRRRAKAIGTATLVALANPDGSLPAAVPEVTEIAAHFNDGHRHVAVGADASEAFLARHSSSASHIHFACHARADIFDSSDAAIELASGDLLASELPRVAGFEARLVVASACQSAIPAIAHIPEEPVSIATAILAAGSACAIASLWPVDDLAAAILMTRVYEEMMLQDRDPPSALRLAQMWLRGLSEKEERDFLSRHPGLEQELSRRLAAGSAPGRRDGTMTGRSGRSNRRPYEPADLWAPFVAVGS